jgi:hypothetical protein
VSSTAGLATSSRRIWRVWAQKPLLVQPERDGYRLSWPRGNQQQTKSSSKAIPVLSPAYTLRTQRRAASEGQILMLPWWRVELLTPEPVASMGNGHPAYFVWRSKSDRTACKATVPLGRRAEYAR